MDPWLIYFVTYNSPLSDASYHAWNMARLPTTLGIWLGVVHAESNALYAHPVEPTKSCGSAQCFNVSASADKHALTQ